MNRKGFMFILFVFALLLPPAKTLSQERPHIVAVKTENPPSIDGELNDSAWQNATKVTGFWRVDVDEMPKEQTEVWLLYDDQNLYVAFKCHDSQPNLIRAQQRKRGGNFDNDDWVSVGIDPFNRPTFAQSIYIFFVNALGTQSELVPGGAASKIEWRGDWQAAAKIVEGGWQAEIAIPFRILRLPVKVSALGLSFYRHIPPPRAITSSFPYRRGYAVYNMAEYSPLNLPPFYPPIIQMLSLSALGGKEVEGGLRVGWDAKQQLTSGLQWQLTLNPDLRNIEDVVETIDFTYVPRLLPDRRPFFTEGEGYFPPSSVFYSRNIKDLSAGAKLFGKLGRTEIGVLSTYETHHHLTLASRFSYDLNKKWLVEANYAHRTGTNLSPAYRLALRGNIPSRKHWIWNFSGDLAFGGADSWNLGLGRYSITPGRFSFFINYSEIGEFRPSVGFKPEVNFREFFSNISYSDRYDKGPVLQWGCYAYYNWRRFRGGSEKGQLLDRGEGFGQFIVWRKGWSVSFNYNRYQRPPFSDQAFNVGLGWKIFDRFREGNISYRWGKRAGESYRFLNLNQSFRLSSRSSLNLHYERLRHKQRTYQWVISGVYDLTPERSLVFRWVKGSIPKYGDPRTLLPIDNFYLGFRQFSRKGIDIYLLFGDPNSRHTKFNLFVKVIRVF